jgi:hypothetical protein
MGRGPLLEDVGFEVTPLSKHSINTTSLIHWTIEVYAPTLHFVDALNRYTTPGASPDNDSSL